MAEINREYADGDEARLRVILSQWETSPDAVTGEGIGAELVRTIRKIHQVEGRLTRIVGEIAELSGSELSVLKASLTMHFMVAPFFDHRADRKEPTMPIQSGTTAWKSRMERSYSA